MKKYCGNNEVALQNGLRNGKYGDLGSRSECLRIGFGRALNSPVDRQYSLPYTPIDEDKFYCGDQHELPDGYDRFGTRPQCLSRGYGIGSSKKAKSLKKTKKRKKPNVKSRQNKRKSKRTSRVKSVSKKKRSKRRARRSRR